MHNVNIYISIKDMARHLERIKIRTLINIPYDKIRIINLEPIRYTYSARRFRRANASGSSLVGDVPEAQNRGRPSINAVAERSEIRLDGFS